METTTGNEAVLSIYQALSPQESEAQSTYEIPNGDVIKPVLSNTTQTTWQHRY
jgi:hypothetical protein